MWTSILELQMPSLLKHLGADYKHELTGERLLTPKNYALKNFEGCDRPWLLCNSANER